MRPISMIMLISSQERVVSPGCPGGDWTVDHRRNWACPMKKTDLTEHEVKMTRYYWPDTTVPMSEHSRTMIRELFEADQQLKAASEEK